MTSAPDAHRGESSARRPLAGRAGVPRRRRDRVVERRDGGPVLVDLDDPQPARAGPRGSGARARSRACAMRSIVGSLRIGFSTSPPARRARARAGGRRRGSRRGRWRHRRADRRSVACPPIVRAGRASLRVTPCRASAVGSGGAERPPQVDGPLQSSECSNSTRIAAPLPVTAEKPSSTATSTPSSKSEVTRARPLSSPSSWRSTPSPRSPATVVRNRSADIGIPLVVWVVVAASVTRRPRSPPRHSSGAAVPRTSRGPGPASPRGPRSPVAAGSR